MFINFSTFAVIFCQLNPFFFKFFVSHFLFNKIQNIHWHCKLYFFITKQYTKKKSVQYFLQTLRSTVILVLTTDWKKVFLFSFCRHLEHTRKNSFFFCFKTITFVQTYSHREWAIYTHKEEKKIFSTQNSEVFFSQTQQLE